MNCGQTKHNHQSSGKEKPCPSSAEKGKAPIGFGAFVKLFGSCLALERFGFVRLVGFVRRSVVMTRVVPVLVIIVGIVVGVLALEVNVVDDDAHDVDAGALNALDGAARVFAANLVEF